MKHNNSTAQLLLSSDIVSNLLFFDDHLNLQLSDSRSPRDGDYGANLTILTNPPYYRAIHSYLGKDWSKHGDLHSAPTKPRTQEHDSRNIEIIKATALVLADVLGESPRMRSLTMEKAI